MDEPEDDGNERHEDPPCGCMACRVGGPWAAEVTEARLRPSPPSTVEF